LFARFKITFVMAVIAVILMPFTNCAESLPDLTLTSSAAGSPNSIGVSVNPQTIGVSESAQVTANGGSPPYVYTVIAGTATVTSGGLVTALGTGSILVEVVDMAGRVAQISVTASNGTAVGSEGSCQTPWGQVVPHGGQVNAFRTATADCPGVCASEVQTCNQGILSGTFSGQASSCTQRVCTYVMTTDGSCPNQTSSGTVLYSVPASCSAAELNKYICYVAGIFSSRRAEYRCSPP